MRSAEIIEFGVSIDKTGECDLISKAHSFCLALELRQVVTVADNHDSRIGDGFFNARQRRDDVIHSFVLLDPPQIKNRGLLESGQAGIGSEGCMIDSAFCHIDNVSIDPARDQVAAS